MFLFLTGVTLAFLMDSSERKGMPPRRRVWTSLQRAGYLFLLAFAFRAFMLVSGIPVSTWSDFLRVDILNCMGFSIAALSIMAAFRTAERARLCAVLGLAIAFASPLISQLNWSGVPWMLRAYIIPDHRFFGVFPWCAYLAFGVSGGSALRLIPAEGSTAPCSGRALAAAGAIACCQYCAHSPYSIYAASDFWLNSPAQVLIKQSVILIMLAFAFVWTQYVARDRWSWIRQFGTTSLLVYWVHIELIYGRWMWFFKENLNVPESCRSCRGRHFLYAGNLRGEDAPRGVARLAESSFSRHTRKWVARPPHHRSNGIARAAVTLLVNEVDVGPDHVSRRLAGDSARSNYAGPDRPECYPGRHSSSNVLRRDDLQPTVE